MDGFYGHSSLVIYHFLLIDKKEKFLPLPSQRFSARITATVYVC